VIIRPGREEDAPAYRELRLEALRNHPDAFSADYAASEARPMSYWIDRLRPGEELNVPRMYFAVHGNELIGMCGIFVENSIKLRHSATIISMYVKAGWRGRHIGERLVTACLDWARPHGVGIAKLAVVTTNTAAIRCYARCGFRVYGIEPQALLHDGVYYDELLMARPA
jgi:RimJ/RimL family protein N-acetyltransferase